MNSSSLKRLCEILTTRCPETVDLLVAVTESDFDAAFAPWLAQAIRDLEKNSKNFSTLGETGLVAALAMGLRMPGLSIQQEVNSNGHVDLTISLDHSHPLLFSLGEAKIHDGPVLHKKGLAQLMNRYMTGRESQCLMLSFVQKKDIAGKVIELRADMNKSKPSGQQEDCVDLPDKWAFKTVHLHATGDLRSVAHYHCNLFNPVAATTTSTVE